MAKAASPATPSAAKRSRASRTAQAAPVSAGVSRPRRTAASTSHPAAATGEAASHTGTSAPPGPAERVLKKYPNRRLYDAQTSSYITLSDVKSMVLKGVEFVVRDAKTGEDITRSILLQIILEEESGGVPLFTSQALAQIIRIYGHAMQGLMGNYLERNLQILSELQQRFTDQAKGLVDGRLGATDAWAQLLKGNPLAQGGLMGNYLEQSKAAMSQFQEQMGKQAQAMMSGLSAFKPPKG